MNNFLPGEIGGLPVRRAGYDIFEDLPGYQPKPAILGGIFDDPAFQFGLGVLAHNTSKNPAQALMGGMRGLQDFQKQKSADAYNQQMQQYNMTQAETARMKAITDRKKLFAQQKALQDEAESGARMMKAIYGADFTPQVEGDDWNLLPVSDMHGGQLTQGQTGQLGIDFANPNRANAKMFGLADEDMVSIAQIAQSDPKTAMKMVSEAFKSRLRGQKEAKDVIAKERAMAEEMGMPLGEYLRQKMFKPGQSININNVMPSEAAEAAGKKEGFDIGEQAAMIENKYSAIDSVREAKDMLRQGIYTGYWADVGKTLAKASMGAVGDRQKAARTEQFMSYIGNTVVPRLKEFGGNDSNEEMRYLQKIMGGDITMEPEAISAILESAERKISRGIERLQRQRGALEKGKMPDLGPGPARGQTKPTKPADLKAAPSVDDLLKKYGGK